MGETDFKEMLWRQWWSKKRFGGQGITDGGGEEEEYLWKIQHDALLKGVVQSIFQAKIAQDGHSLVPVKRFIDGKGGRKSLLKDYRVLAHFLWVSWALAVLAGCVCGSILQIATLFVCERLPSGQILVPWACEVKCCVWQ